MPVKKVWDIGDEVIFSETEKYPHSIWNGTEGIVVAIDNYVRIKYTKMGDNLTNPAYRRNMIGQIGGWNGTEVELIHSIRPPKCEDWS